MFRGVTRRQVVRDGVVPAALAATATACGPLPGQPQPEPSAAKRPVKLLYILHNSTKRRVDEEHLPEYKAQNPHLDVEFSIVPDAELPGKVAALSAAGTGPEIFNPSNGPSTVMLQRGWAAEVDYRAVGVGSAKKFVEAYASPTVIDGWKWNGKYHGLPTEVSNYCLFINNSLFRAAGLDPQRDYPRDWDQMVEVAFKLSRREGGELVQRGFELHYGGIHNVWGGQGYQLSGPFLTEDGKVSATSEGYVRSTQWWADFVRKHQLGSPQLPSFPDAFIQGKLAMLTLGSFFAPRVRRDNPELFNDMTIKPLPRWRDKKHDHGTHVYGYAMLVSSQANADVRAEAWKLAWFLSSYPLDHLREGGLFQPKRDFVESPAFKNFKDVPSMDVFLDDMKKSTYFYTSPVTMEIRDLINKTTLPKAWTEGEPPREVLADFQRQVEQLVASARTTR